MEAPPTASGLSTSSTAPASPPPTRSLRPATRPTPGAKRSTRPRSIAPLVAGSSRRSPTARTGCPWPSIPPPPPLHHTHPPPRHRTSPPPTRRPPRDPPASPPPPTLSDPPPPHHPPRPHPQQ